MQKQINHKTIIFNEKDSIPETDKVNEYRFLQGKIVGELAKKAYPDGIDIPSNGFIENTVFPGKPVF